MVARTTEKRFLVTPGRLEMMFLGLLLRCSAPLTRTRNFTEMPTGEARWLLLKPRLEVGLWVAALHGTYLVVTASLGDRKCLSFTILAERLQDTWQPRTRITNLGS